MTFALALVALFTGVLSILNGRDSAAGDAQFRRRIVLSSAIVGLILVLVVAGNAAWHFIRGPLPETVSEYHDDQRRICFSLLGFLGDIGPTDDKRPRAALIDRDQRVFDDLSTRLHALRPPPHYKSENDELTSAIDAYRQVLDSVPSAPSASDMRRIDAATGRLLQPQVLQNCLTDGTRTES